MSQDDQDDKRSVEDHGHDDDDDDQEGSATVIKIVQILVKLKVKMVRPRLFLVKVIYLNKMKLLVSVV